MQWVVVDVGNSFMKWGLVKKQEVTATARLPLDDHVSFARQVLDWKLNESTWWAVAGVNPEPTSRLRHWLTVPGKQVLIIDSHKQVPLLLRIQHPETVGLDRLFDAVAAAARGVPAIVVDAGTAVTVDYVDGDGAFCGGAIMPGLGLMSKALHEHTAQLPKVAVTGGYPPFPGKATVPALIAGIHGAVVGGIGYLVERLRRHVNLSMRLYVTGGDAPLLYPSLEASFELWPKMTLEGIRLTALHHPWLPT